jgi:hypothetical protein
MLPFIVALEHTASSNYKLFRIYVDILHLDDMDSITRGSILKMQSMQRNSMNDLFLLATALTKEKNRTEGHLT